MIENFFTRCAIQDAPLRRLQEKVMKENLPSNERIKLVKNERQKKDRFHLL